MALSWWFLVDALPKLFQLSCHVILVIRKPIPYTFDRQKNLLSMHTTLGNYDLLHFLASEAKNFRTKETLFQLEIEKFQKICGFQQK